MFTDKFPGADANNVRDGATIRCVVDGITYTATVHTDDSAGPPDKEDEGFWPSLDPADEGYIGENPTRPYEDQMRDCKAVMRRYKRGEMIYCGVAVTASIAGVELLGAWTHALWRIDINWPFGDNSYLTEAANELLPEAKAQAQAHISEHITRLLGQTARLGDQITQLEAVATLLEARDA